MVAACLIPTSNSLDELEAQKRRAMNALTFEQRGWAGLDMFELIGESILTGIRMTNPDSSEEELHEQYLRRITDVREGGRGP